MPVVLEAVSVSAAVAAKIKTAMEYRAGQALTDAEAKAAFRQMVLQQAKRKVIGCLHDAASRAVESDVADVATDFSGA